MQAYPSRLRHRVVERAERSFREAACLLLVGRSSVVRWCQRGGVLLKPHGGSTCRKLNVAAQTRLLDLIRDQPDVTPPPNCATVTASNAASK